MISSMDQTSPSAESAAADDLGFRRIGIFIVLTVFGVFGAWAALAPLSSAAHAPGVVSVEGYRKTVQHLEGGIVRSIEVRDGQSVGLGEVLLTLDDTQPRAELEVLRGQLLIALAREARLVAQRDGLGSVVYGPELLQNEQDSQAQEAMRLQNQTFTVRKSAHDGEVRLYQQQIGQLEARVAGLTAQRASRVQLAESFRGELHDFETLMEEGYAEMQKVRELDRSLAQSEGQVGELTSSIAATSLQVSETKLKILQLEKEFQRDVAKELSEVQSELFDLRGKLRSSEDTVARMVVKAPQAGTVLNLAVHTTGAVIGPGAKLLDIVPQDERLIVEAKVSPSDVDRVRIGQSAEIRFSAFKTRDTPTVQGRMVDLSADRLVDDRDPSEQPYYLARVEIPADALQVLAERELVLVAGMPAEVLILTGERTLFEYLLDPLEDTIARSLIED